MRAFLILTLVFNGGAGAQQSPLTIQQRSQMDGAVKMVLEEDAAAQRRIDEKKASEAVALTSLAYYKKCVISNAILLDDGISDASTVAAGSESKCEAWLAGVVAGAPENRQEELMQTTKSNMRAAIVEAVLADRKRARQKKPPPIEPRSKQSTST